MTLYMFRIISREETDRAILFSLDKTMFWDRVQIFQVPLFYILAVTSLHFYELTAQVFEGD
jgi:hypothetical protein